MCTEGSEQRADTDSGSAEVVDLINLQAGINLAASGQNLINLIGGNGVETAAERVQLNQVKIVACLYPATLIFQRKWKERCGCLIMRYLS